MKKLLSFTILLFVFTGSIFSQFYKSVLPSPAFTSALEKIVLDFRFNFKNIKGDSLQKEGGTETYKSSVKLPGAEDCFITYYSSRLDTTASWQANIYTGSNFNEAVNAYQNIFRLVKKSHLNWVDHGLMRFSGAIQEPKQEVGFASSSLKLDLEDVRYRRFEATIELLQVGYDNWEVHLNIQTKKQDTEKY